MFSDPQKNIQQFAVTPGMTVADCGSGSGFCTLAAARAVGSMGKVYAIDINKEMLERIIRTAQHEGLENIETIWGDIDEPNGTRLADEAVQRVILSNALFQVEKKEVLVEEIKRILRPDGRVLVVDWTDSFGGLGPQPDHVVSRQTAQALF